MVIRTGIGAALVAVNSGGLTLGTGVITVFVAVGMGLLWTHRDRFDGRSVYPNGSRRLDRSRGAWITAMVFGSAYLALGLSWLVYRFS